MLRKIVNCIRDFKKLLSIGPIQTNRLMFSPQGAEDDLHQAGLARTIAANQPYDVAGRALQVDIREYLSAVERKAYTIYFQSIQRAIIFVTLKMTSDSVVSISNEKRSSLLCSARDCRRSKDIFCDPSSRRR